MNTNQKNIENQISNLIKIINNEINIGATTPLIQVEKFIQKYRKIMRIRR